MTSSVVTFLIASSVLTIVFSCSAGGIGGTDDYQYIEDPVFTMSISPPIGWTFFPPKTSDSSTTWYFVGQSNDSIIAKQRCNNEVRAAMLDALNAANMMLYGIEITNDFTPIQVENPVGMSKGNGPLYGKVEAGALVQTSIGGQADFAFKTFTVPMKVNIRDAGNTKYKWNIVKNTFMQKLSLNFNARFNGEINFEKY